MKKIIYAILALFLFISPAVADGEWQNFSFKIDEKFSVSRSSPADIDLFLKGEKLTGEGEVGPLYELIVLPAYIVTHHYGEKEGQADTSKEFFYAVKRVDGEVRGPIEKKDIGSFHDIVPRDASWTSLRDMYKWALRTGRADYEEVDKSIIGQFKFTFKNIHYFALYAFLPGILIGFFLAKRKKKRPFLKGWLIAFLLILGVISIVSLWGWADLRFRWF